MNDIILLIAQAQTLFAEATDNTAVLIANVVMGGLLQHPHRLAQPHEWLQAESRGELSGNNLKVSGIINLPCLGSLSGGKLLCPEQYIEGFASVPVRIVENRPRVPLLNSIEPSIGWSHPLTKKGDACSLPTWQANLVEEPSNT